MRIVAAFIAFSALGLAVPAQGQLHYDPYLVLPNGADGLYAGLRNDDMGGLDQASDLFVLAKWAPTADWEVGGRLLGGVWRRGGDAVDGLSMGGKYLLRGETDALSANVLIPVGRSDEWGVSLGYMRTTYFGKGVGLSAWGRVGGLDGYADGLLRADILLQPYWAARQRLIVFVDLGLAGSSRDAGDSLAVRLEPNVDLMLGENSALNLGLSLGIVGKGRQRDPGLSAALLWSY